MAKTGNVRLELVEQRNSPDECCCLHPVIVMSPADGEAVPSYEDRLGIEWIDGGEEPSPRTCVQCRLPALVVRVRRRRGALRSSPGE